MAKVGFTHDNKSNKTTEWEENIMDNDEFYRPEAVIGWMAVAAFIWLCIAILYWVVQ